MRFLPSSSGKPGGFRGLLFILDPRTKLLLAALFTTLVFILDVLTLAAAQTLVFIGLCLAAGIPLKKLFAYARFVLPLTALLIALQAFFGQGLFTGLMIGCRVISLVVLMPLLTTTTDTRRLAFGITRLGLNYKAAYVITSTLNLVPSFEEEARLIMDARKLRGIQSVRLAEYPAIALPLLIKAMRHAQQSSLAMDSRAFGAYKARTWMHETPLRASDWLAFAAGIVWAAAVITANILLKR